MSTPLLPTEIWHDIGSYFERQDHCSLVLVNKHFNAVFLPVLYSHPIITGPPESIVDGEIPETEKTSRYALAGTHASLVLNKLEDEMIRNSVRECTLSRFWPYSKPVLFEFGGAPMHSYEGLMTSIFTLIGRLPSLRKLHLMKVQIPATCMLYICTRPNQTLDISDNMAGFYGSVDVEPNTTFTVSAMRFHSYIFENPIVSQISMGGSLRELHIAGGGHSGLRQFYDAHIHCGAITLPNLERLEIGWLNAGYLPFLKMTPNLRRLRLKTSFKLELGTTPLDIDVVPKLCHFTGHNSYLKVFTKGRPITTIVTRDSSGDVSEVFTGQHDNIALSELGRFFGAADNVHEVVWEKCSRNRELMTYLVQHNPRVVHLTMTPSVDYAREELHDRLQILKDLKELRTLKIRCLSHVPFQHSLDWERAHCESLQSEGSKGLVFISFSKLIDWNRADNGSVWIPSGEGMSVYEMYRNPLPRSILPLVEAVM